MSFYKPGEYEAWVAKRLKTIEGAVKNRQLLKAYVDGDIDEKLLQEEAVKKQSQPIVDAIEKIDKDLAVMTANKVK